MFPWTKVVKKKKLLKIDSNSMTHIYNLSLYVAPDYTNHTQMYVISILSVYISVCY